MNPFRHRDPPDALAGFGGIGRYWDPTADLFAAKILPGEYYVTRNEEMIVTVLGSCVSACVRDPVAKIGGMNHFMLPSSGDVEAEDAARYGNFAMEKLVNDLLKNGACRIDLEVKLIGGGRVLPGLSDIGKKNIEFVRNYVRDERLRVLAEDLGDVYPRKVYYYPNTGKVRLKKLRSLNNETIFERESRYMGELNSNPIGGDVELF